MTYSEQPTDTAQDTSKDLLLGELQTFLYDARDQHAALNAMLDRLSAMEQSAKALHTATVHTNRAMEHTARNGLTVQIEHRASHQIEELSKRLDRMMDLSNALKPSAWKLIASLVALTLLSSFLGAFGGLIIAIRFL